MVMATTKRPGNAGSSSVVRNRQHGGGAQGVPEGVALQHGVRAAEGAVGAAGGVDRRSRTEDAEGREASAGGDGPGREGDRNCGDEGRGTGVVHELAVAAAGTVVRDAAEAGRDRRAAERDPPGR